MTTSSSTNFELDGLGIITQAFKVLGIVAVETPLQAPQVQDGLDTLNLMLKTWQTQSMHLWTQEEGIIFLDKGRAKYSIGPTGDEACNEDDFIGTTTTVAKIATDVIISVSDSTGMTALDIVGIELDDGIRHWTTITTVDNSTQITITVGLPSAAKSGNTVFTYTTQIERPTRITSIRRKTFAIDSEIEIESISRSDYFLQVNKLNQGIVTSAYYSPIRTNGLFYVWQTASNVNDFIRISFDRTIQDVDLTTNTLDIPQEWQETVIYNLAARLSNIYSVPAQRLQIIVSEASAFMQQALEFDEEITSLNIQPDFS